MRPAECQCIAPPERGDKRLMRLGQCGFPGLVNGGRGRVRASGAGLGRGVVPGRAVGGPFLCTRGAAAQDGKDLGDLDREKKR